MARVAFNQAAIDEVLRGPNGPVARDLLRRGLRVESEAKRLCPVDTGRLRSSIRTTVAADGKGPFARVGTEVEYALVVHEGHGDIYPVNGQVLHFTVGGQDVFVTHVGPVEGVHFLTDGLEAAGEGGSGGNVT